MKARRLGRAVVLQCLYELDFTTHTYEFAFEHRSEAETLDGGGKEFAHKLGKGVDTYRQVLDEVTAELAPEWPIDQIATVDRNILRIAVYELLFEGDIPPKVAINEAVELAKSYGSDSSARFINGVLGSLAAKSSTPQQRSAIEERMKAQIQQVS